MHRNAALLRAILDQVRASPNEWVPEGELKLQSFTKEQSSFVAHVRLLQDEQIVEVQQGQTKSLRLTWKGHDAIEQNLVR